jgi:succinate-semialdehyde dehydrogenase/glutarate-semialdehyde dehydrogenase
MTAERERALLDSIPTQLFIGGVWLNAERSATFDVLDPATGEVIRSIANASPADGTKAIAAAARAQKDWARSCGARSTCCRSAPTTSRC